MKLAIILACGVILAGCNHEEKKAFSRGFRNATSGASEAKTRYLEGRSSSPAVPIKSPRRTD